MKHIYKILVLIFLFAIVQGAVAQELKIISFNIRYNSWNNIDGENGWPYRKAAVVKMINEEKPAAIGLQEALIDQLRYLDSALPAYQRVGVGRDDGKEAGEFMAIYYDTSRLEVESYQTVWLSDTPLEPSLGWDAACRRTVTRVCFIEKQTNRDFYYYNTHLDHVGKTARSEETKLIASSFTGSRRALACAAIIGGDMNSTIDDTIFQSFYDVGFRPAREMTATTSQKDTYNAFGKGKGAVIDHFFVRGLKVESFRTLDGDYGVPYISDHYPIEIVVRL
ncbi:MAG: endonuclease/exonuclease/phosphatase family protein [Bacteroidales bacterium]|nr:endonuclease/exonuclease/phosphatase family protein [Bacteroidales bacterium]